ncbi:type I 3-dehydroquinate dehydratase [bacterium]|nr:type I 3-dehydroquinate dehydratase [bacterium]
MIDCTTPKIVAVLSAAGLEKDIEAALDAPPDMVEYRADLRDKVTARGIRAHLDIVTGALSCPVLFTLRDAREGGGYSGTQAARVALYKAALPHVDAVDIELRNAAAAARLRADIAKHGVTLVLSYHNFEATPVARELDAMVAQGVTHHADIVKIATLCRTGSEALRLLALPVKHPGTKIAVVGMGARGRAVRAVAPSFGSVLGYASASRAVASGQLAVSELRHVWRLLE